MRRLAKAPSTSSRSGPERPRKRLGLVCLFALGLTAFAGANAGSAAAACPNEALRERQHSTFLAECRAYEQVTPTDKNGSNVAPGEVNPDTPEPLSASATVSASGNQATFIMNSPLPGAEAFPGYNYVNSLRGTSDWSTRSVTTRQTPWSQGSMFSTSLEVSPTSSLEFSEFALTPDAVEGNNNIYIRDSATGAYKLVATIPDPNSPTVEQQTAAGVGPDFAVFAQQHALLPGASEFTGLSLNLYSYFDGQLHLLNTPGWDVGLANGVFVDSRTHAVSADGSRVYFGQSNGSESGLFMSEDGEPPVVVSHRLGDPATPVPANFLGASVDGSVAYFMAKGGLTADTQESSSSVLYRYSAATGEITAVTPSLSEDPAVEGFTSIRSTPVNDDGSFVYFVSDKVLASGGTAGERNIYAWHNGQTKLVSTLEYSSDPGGQWGLSPDGTKFVFLAQSKLTAFDNTNGGKDCALRGGGPLSGLCSEAYLFDWDTGELTCASCPAVGVRAQGSAALGGISRLNLSIGPELFARSVRNDGTVFFDTAQPLVPGDTNGKRDVYEYHDGVAQLISTGTSPSDSIYHGMGADGKDVYFSTGQRLVSQDIDDLADMYDARVDGGLVSQEPLPSPAPCQGTSCQNAAAPPPGSVTIASDQIHGAGNVTTPRKPAKKRCVPKRKAHAKKRSHGKRAGNSAKQLRRGAACKGGNR